MKVVLRFPPIVVLVSVLLSSCQLVQPVQFNQLAQTPTPAPEWVNYNMQNSGMPGLSVRDLSLDSSGASAAVSCQRPNETLSEPTIPPPEGKTRSESERSEGAEVAHTRASTFGGKVTQVGATRVG